MICLPAVTHAHAVIHVPVVILVHIVVQVLGIVHCVA
jgi:hypothetical protein